MPDGFVDPYIDLRTGVLRNLVGAGTWDELRNAEGELVAMRTSEFLRELPLEPTGTLDDLRLIHRWLFRDVYDWAGEVRTIEIRKAGEGAQFFLPSANIPRGIAWARSELEKDDFLVGLASRRFPAAWPTTMTTTTSRTPFARAMGERNGCSGPSSAITRVTTSTGGTLPVRRMTRRAVWRPRTVTWAPSCPSLPGSLRRAIPWCPSMPAWCRLAILVGRESCRPRGGASSVSPGHPGGLPPEDAYMKSLHAPPIIAVIWRRGVCPCCCHLLWAGVASAAQSW